MKRLNKWDNGQGKILAATNVSSVQEPGDMDLGFYKTLGANSGDVYRILHTGFLNLMMQRSKSSGWKGDGVYLSPESPLLEKSSNDAGSINSVLKIRAAKVKDGYRISIPIFSDISLFGGFHTNTLGLTRETNSQDWDKDRSSFADLITKLITQTVGSKGLDAFLHPTTALDLPVLDSKDSMVDTQNFKLTDNVLEAHGKSVSKSGKEKISKFAVPTPVFLKSLLSAFRGYRLIGPKLTRQFYLNPNILKEGASGLLQNNSEHPGWPTKDQVGDKSGFILALSQRRVSVYADLVISEDWARFMTQQSTGQVNPRYLIYWFATWLSGLDSGRKKKRKEMFRSITDMRSIRDTKPLNPKAPEQNKAKVINTAGMAIDDEGYPVYIPDVDNTELYESNADKSCKAANGEFSFSDELELDLNKFSFDENQESKKALSEKHNLLPKNWPIYTDWDNLKFNYSSDLGEPRVLDMEYLTAFTVTHANNLLSKSIDPSSMRGGRFLRELEYFLRNRMTELKLKDPMHYIVDAFAEAGVEGPIATRISNAYTLGLKAVLDQASYVEKAKDREASGNFDYKDLFDKSKPAVSWIGRILADAAVSIQKLKPVELANYVGGRSVENSLYEMGMVFAFGRYGPKYEQVRTEDLKLRDVYLNPKIDPKHKAKPTPYIRDNRMLLAHQNRIDGIFENNPNARWVVLGADPGGGKCLTGNSLVQTTSGLLSLKELWNKSKSSEVNGYKELEVGIYTNQNEIQKTSHVYRTQGFTHKVTLTDGTEIEGLPEHKLWVYRDHEMKFVRLDELTDGDLVPKSSGSRLFGNSTKLKFDLENSSNARGVDSFKERGFTIPTKLTTELAELMGWIVAEGQLKKGGGGVNISNYDPDMLNRISKLFEKVFGAPLKDKEWLVRDGINRYVGLDLPGVVLNRFFGKYLTYGKSDTRVVPKVIRKSTENIQCAFLRGYFEGDGSVYNSTEKGKKKYGWHIEASSISGKLIQHIQFLLENMGIGVVVKKGWSWATNGSENQVSKRVYQIHLINTKENIERFQTKIGFLSERKKKRLENMVKANLDREYNQLQATNLTTFKDHNKIPAGDTATKLALRMERLLNSTSYTTCRGIEIPYTLYRLHLDGVVEGCANGIGQMSIDGAVTTRHKLGKLHKLTATFPKEASKLIRRDKKCKKWFEELDTLSKYKWVIVKSSEPTGKKKTVYDLTIPEYENYAVQGVYGHNTGMCLRHALTSIKAGRFKRPLFVMPRNLINNYLEDGTYFYGGSVNYIPITSLTLLRYGMDGIRRMVESSPPNTILLTTYSFLGKNAQAHYGLSNIQVAPNADFMRLLNIDAVYLDESHNLRNESNQTINVRKMVTYVPNRFLATGTLVNNNLADIASQMTLFDPSILGSKEEFKEEYALEMRGGKVTEWKPGAEKKLAKRMSEHVLFVTAKKKEWAVYLPKKEENILVISPEEGGPLWYDAYRAILLEAIDEIKKKQELMELLDESDNSGDAADAQLEFLLRPYLQRLEMFTVAPELDVVGQKLGIKQGPMIKGINSRIMYHVTNKIPGKILIFTQYGKSALSIYEHLPPEVKSRFILYSASNSKRDLARFDRDESVIGLVGIEATLKEGLNLQKAGRLCRVEAGWTPGSVEQGDSRLFRPDPKNRGKTRGKIYIDHLLVNKCLIGSSLVQTNKGLLRIQDMGNVESSRKIQPVSSTKISSIGGEEKVLSWWNQGLGLTRVIHTDKGHKLQGTLKHGVLVFKEGKYFWVQLQDVKRGDLVCISLKKLVRQTPLRLNLTIPVLSNKHELGRRKKKDLYDYLSSGKEFTSKDLKEIGGGCPYNLINTLVKQKKLRVVKKKGGTNPGVYAATSLLTRDCLTSFKESPGRVQKVPKYMTPDLAYSLGLFIAEGGVFCSTTILGMQNREPIQYVVNTFNNVFGTKLELGERELDPDRSKSIGNVVYEDTMYYLKGSHSRTLLDVLSQLGCNVTHGKRRGKGASYRKVIPWSVLEADENSQLAFLAGMWEGDGSSSNGVWSISSFSEEVRESLQILLNSHGYVAYNCNTGVGVPQSNSQKLWNSLIPYIKGPKKFKPIVRAGFRDRNSGVPFEYWASLLQSRFVRKERPKSNTNKGGTTGGDYFVFRQDDGKEIKLQGRDSVYYVNGKSISLLRYSAFEEGAYDKLLLTLKKVSRSAYDLLITALDQRYEYEKVVSNKNGGIHQVFDLSVSNGEDGKYPAYVAQGLISHNTVQISKMARLISKTLVKAAFDEHDNPNYDGLPSMELVSMSLETIAGLNDYEAELKDYAEAYSLYQGIRNRDLDEYRDDPRNDFEMVDIPRGKGIEGEAIMQVTPYVEDMPSFGAPYVDLIPIMDYMRDVAHMDDIKEFDPTGLKVNSEFGDGTIIRSTTERVTIEFNKTKVKQSVNKMSVLIYADQKANHQEMRAAIAESVKMPLVKDTSLEVNTRWQKNLVKVKKTQKKERLQQEKEDKQQQRLEDIRKRDAARKAKIKQRQIVDEDEDEEGEDEEQQEYTLDLALYATYDLVALGVQDEEIPDDVREDLVDFGFRDVGKYTIASFKTRQAYIKWLDKIQDTFDIERQYLDKLELVKKAYIKQGTSAIFSAKRAVAYDLRNFWRMQIKPSAKNELRLYPVILDHELHVAWRWKNQPAAAKVKSLVVVPGVTYSVLDDELLLFVRDKGVAQNKIASLKKRGYNILKPKTLLKSLKDLRIHK